MLYIHYLQFILCYGIYLCHLFTNFIMVINTIVALLLAIRRGHINSFKKQNLIVKIKFHFNPIKK